MVPAGLAIAATERWPRIAIAVVVPANAYFVDVSYGAGWKCNRGYEDVSGACVQVALPANAHLDYSGSEWDCDRPYRRELDRCALPERR